jgi:aryl-alcohol dehydrogenase-like predicted oxidoreductase
VLAASTSEQLAENLGSLSIRLSGEQIRRLNALAAE